MQTNTLVQAFTYGQKPVRTISIEGEPWFSANDVCEVLGYTNPREAVRKHCKEHGVTKRDIIDSLSREQSATFISEPNLYRLVVRSRKAEAEQFEAWVMEQVLPQIRKTGTYRTPLGIQDDPILALLHSTIEVRQGQLALEKRVATLELQQEAAREAVDALPAPTVEAPELSTRKRCREAVNVLVGMTGRSHHDVWKTAYAKFDLSYNLCLTKRAKGGEKLDWIEANGRIDDLYAILSKMLDTAKQAA